MTSQTDAPAHATEQRKSASGGTRVLVLAGIALLAFMSLGAWAFSSPVGSSPDDRYHLASIWCDDTLGVSCEQNAEGRNLMPAALLESPCYLGSPTTSAGCQPFMDGTDPRVQADPGSDVDRNLYPGGFYTVLNLFTTDNIEVAILTMRLFNVLLFVLSGVVLWITLARRLQRTLVWTWALTLIPLAAFLIPSTNPTSWAIVGVGMAWLALLGYFEATGWRVYVLGALYVVLVAVATGARSDSTLFVGATSIITLFMTQADKKTLIRRFILPAAAGLGVITWLIFKPGQIGIITEGFGERAQQSYPDELPWQTGVEVSTGFDWSLFWYNTWDAPALWLGMFGDYPWGALGWLDTVMPQAVTALVTWMILGVTFIALRNAWWQKWFAAGSMIFLAWFIPVWTLQQGGHKIGEQIQPRYLIPLFIVAIGVLLLQKRSDQVLIASRAGQVGIIVALSIANSVALHANTRRYTTGTVRGGIDLDYERDWWWSSLPNFLGANALWVIGSLSFFALLWFAIRNVNSVGEPPQSHPEGLSGPVATPPPGVVLGTGTGTKETEGKPARVRGRHSASSRSST